LLERKNKTFDTHREQEACILVGLSTQQQSRKALQEYLDELEFLAITANAKCLRRFTQQLDRPDIRTYLGSGKLNELKELTRELKPSLILFDDELSPSQLRNLEQEFKEPEVRVVDRTRLILDIFASRARTAHAKKQVELAQYEYLLPRLTRMWTHLEKQRGGIGMRGPGEQEIETDRRIVRDRIAFLKDQLKDIDRQMQTQRGNRGAMVRVALVGYTNVGKSTLMNVLSKSDVFAENKLFATLDTTVRKVVIQNLPFLLADTVGFIRKLPHQLIESFKSTLDETREADLLLHVLDISHPSHEEHFRVVTETLASIGAGNVPVILVFNKTDAYKAEQRDMDDLTELQPQQWSLEELKQHWYNTQSDKQVVFISAQQKENLNGLKEMIYERVRQIHIQRYPHNHFLYDSYC
jgi:GTP-binding protein HflX